MKVGGPLTKVRINGYLFNNENVLLILRYISVILLDKQGDQCSYMLEKNYVCLEKTWSFRTISSVLCKCIIQSCKRFFPRKPAANWASKIVGSDLYL